MGKMTVLLVLFAASALVGGCGKSGPEGKYACNGLANATFDFKGDGTGYATVMGNETTFEYKVDGEKLVMTGNGKTNVLTITKDSLVGNGAIGTCTPG